MLSTIGRTRTHYGDRFKHPRLSDEELRNGCRLGLDSWADTGCSGKHSYVEEFIEGKTVTATGFTSALGSMKDLPMANVVYAYDTKDGATILLEYNNTIYMGSDMDDSLCNPIQLEENNVRVDLRPKAYYPSESGAQSITFSNDFSIPIDYDGVLPCISIRRPTAHELATCERLQLSSKYDWDPYKFKSSFCATSTRNNDIFEMYLDYNDNTDPISSELSFMSINTFIANSEPTYLPNLDAENHSSIHAVKRATSSSLSPQELSKLWRIGLKTASDTLKATTHQCIRTTGVLAKRFKTDRSQLRYKQLSKRYGPFYVDFLKSNVTSIRQYIGGTLYTNKLGFKQFFPCTNETSEETGATLRSFIELVGLPPALHSDNHGNFKDGLFKRLLRRFGIASTYTEPHSPWQNRAEAAIGELKRHARKIMQETQTPIRLWCFAYEYSANILSLCTTTRYDLHGRTPYEATMNYTPDISEYASFGWYQWCWYYDEKTKTKQLCRWLGPSHGIGQSFCSYILLDNGSFIARSSVIGISEAELHEENLKRLCDQFTKSVNEKIGNYKQGAYNDSQPGEIYYTAFGDQSDEDDNVLPYGAEEQSPQFDEVNQEYLDSLDNYIGTNVTIPGKNGEPPVIAIIKGRKRDHLGNPIGEKHINPVLDTRVYNLEFPDGRVEEYGVNTIVENICEQVDEYGWDSGLVDEIVSFRKDEEVAIPKGERSVVQVNGITKPVITTKGWDIQIRWTDGTTDFIPLYLAKQSMPIQVAEYALANGYESEPAFKWWVKKVLRHHKRTISKVKARMRKPNRFKFGVKVPMTVEEALRLDHENGNTLWFDAIEKEMKNSRVAFKLLGREDNPPVGFKEITCHLIFDVKMDLTRKARYVAGGHLTDPPSSLTYASVVSRDSVRIAFLVAALNNLDILAGDIQNAYLNAETKEKVYFRAGDEWKSDQGKVVVIVRALYGLKSSALAWRNHLSEILGNKYLGFQSSLADPDVWFKASVKPDGSKYYSYILVYVDDILIVDQNPKTYMDMLESKYTVKPSSIGEPKVYLGADIGKAYYPDGSYSWTMSSDSYVKEAIKNVKKRLKDDSLEFNKKLSDKNYSPKQPFSNASYRPELDTSQECDDDQTNFYQNLIGVLRWIIELGRIDIAFEVSTLSRYLAQPRTGHLVQALHIFKYLEIHSRNDLAFDPMYHTFVSDLKNDELIQSMKDLYVDAVEDLPTNAPEPRGLPVQLNCFVDADHAGDRKTRRSQTGIILYGNSAPLVWYSKRQNTVESSTFGSEFVALRIATELIKSLRYKLRMFGVPLDGPTNLFCDNEAVYKNSSLAESQLKRKHQSICYHTVRECVAAGIMVVHWVDSKYNLADILTKSLPASSRIFLRSHIMYTDKDDFDRQSLAN